MTLLACAAPETPAAAVGVAGADDWASVVDTLTLAFAADPAARWLYPESRQYLRYFPAFVEAFAGEALDSGTAFMSRDRTGAGLWLPPGASPNEDALGALLEASLAPREKVDASAVFEAMARCHPKAAHWYLPLTGVEPAQQGRGYGSALLRAALGRCDAARLPAYLEATSERNARLYARHGFVAVGRIEIGRCPPIVPMLRPAR